MADILIKGVEMPKGDTLTLFTTVEVFRDGTVVQGGKGIGQVVEVKPHGELKDFNDILTIFDKVIHDVDDKTNALLCALLVQIQYAPTVLEATWKDGLFYPLEASDGCN